MRKGGQVATRRVQEYSISINGKKSKLEIQKAWEANRVPYRIDDGLPVIDDGKVLLCLNQFRFIQENIRPVPEDSAWSSAALNLQIAAHHRFHTIRKEMHHRTMFPFHLRLLAHVMPLNVCISYAPTMNVQSDEGFNNIMQTAMDKIREALAAMVKDPANLMAHDISITMQTIKYLYDVKNVVTIY
jgi:hypothetical protein